MKTIYLIRHSKPDRTSNIKDIPLSNGGIEKAKLLKTKLPVINKIYLSSLLRAKETANILCKEV